MRGRSFVRVIEAGNLTRDCRPYDLHIVLTLRTSIYTPGFTICHALPLIMYLKLGVRSHPYLKNARGIFCYFEPEC